MRQVFLSPFDIAVFGPNAEKPNEQVVYLLTDHVARIKNIDSQMAPITNIEQSPNGNYLLLTTQEPDAPPTYCVAEKQAQDLKPCQSVIGDIVTSKEYTPNESPTVYWNMNKAQELLIEFPSDIETVFSFDPWDKKATRRDRTYINTEAEGAQIKKDQSLGKYYDIRRYGPLTIMKESNPVSNKRPPQFWYWIPPSSPIVWITKYQFIYTKGKNAYIVNVREKKRSVLSTRAEDISSITTYQASILGQ